MSVRLRRFFFFQAEDGIRDVAVTGVQTCALPISCHRRSPTRCNEWARSPGKSCRRSEEHTSELQSRLHLVCRLLLEKNNKRSNDGSSLRGASLSWFVATFVVM